MFVFNTTFVVEVSVYGRWYNWMKDTYQPLIQSMLSTCEVAIYEVMTVQNEGERTFSVQWKVNTPVDLEVINKQSPVVLGQMSSDFGAKVLFFSSVLKAVE